MKAIILLFSVFFCLSFQAFSKAPSLGEHKTYLPNEQQTAQTCPSIVYSVQSSKVFTHTIPSWLTRLKKFVETLVDYDGFYSSYLVYEVNENILDQMQEVSKFISKTHESEKGSDTKIYDFYFLKKLNEDETKWHPNTMYRSSTFDDGIENALNCGFANGYIAINQHNFKALEMEFPGLFDSPIGVTHSQPDQNHFRLY